MLLFTYKCNVVKWEKSKNPPPKDKKVKYSDIEQIFKQIDTYLEKIRESSKNTETKVEKKSL